MPSKRKVKAQKPGPRKTQEPVTGYPNPPTPAPGPKLTRLPVPVTSEKYSDWVYENVDVILMDHGWDEAQAITYVTKTVPPPPDIAKGTSEAEGSEADEVAPLSPLPRLTSHCRQPQAQNHKARPQYLHHLHHTSEMNGRRS